MSRLADTFGRMLGSWQSERYEKLFELRVLVEGEIQTVGGHGMGLAGLVEAEL